MYGDKQEAFSLQELTEALCRGWSVVSIDYRLNPGVLLPDIVDDMQDAYNWVRGQLTTLQNIDPDNIVVFGQSAGGGLALMSGFFLSPPPKAVIAFYPCCSNFLDDYFYNPATPLKESLFFQDEALSQPIITESPSITPNNPRVVFFYEALIQQKSGWALVTHNLEENPAKIQKILTEFTPMLHVSQSYPPTYLCHGLNDSLVPYNQSTQMASVLATNNITHQLKLVPGANHAFDANATSQQWEEFILPLYNFAEEFLIEEDGIVSPLQ